MQQNWFSAIGWMATVFSGCEHTSQPGWKAFHTRSVKPRRVLSENGSCPLVPLAETELKDSMNSSLRQSLHQQSTALNLVYANARLPPPKKALLPSLNGWRKDMGDRKYGRQRALFAPFTHQRSYKLPRMWKPPALPCPFADRLGGAEWTVVP